MTATIQRLFMTACLMRESSQRKRLLYLSSSDNVMILYCIYMISIWHLILWFIQMECQLFCKYYYQLSLNIDAWKSCIQIKYRISMRLSALNTAFPCVCKMPNTCNGIASSVQRVKIHIWESTQPTEKTIFLVPI